MEDKCPEKNIDYKTKANEILHKLYTDDQFIKEWEDEGKEYPYNSFGYLEDIK